MTRSPLDRRSHPVRRRLAASALVLAAAGGTLIGYAGVASAHTGALSGVAACRSDGTYAVTWTLTTTGVPVGDTAVVTPASVEPGSQLTGLPQSVVGDATGTPVTQRGVPGTALVAGLTVDLHWTGTDTYDGTAEGTVVLAGTCRAVVTPPTTPPTMPPTVPIPPSSPVTPTPPTTPTTPTTTPTTPTTPIVATPTPVQAPAAQAPAAAPVQLAPAPSAQPCSYTSMTAAECTSPPVVDGVVQGDG